MRSNKVFKEPGAGRPHYDLEMAKDRVAKQAARIQPHPHDETGALQPI